MKIDVLTQSPARGDLVRFHLEGKFKDTSVPRSEFNGSRLSSVLLRDRKLRVLHVGLGNRNSLNPDRLRRAAGAAVRSLLQIGAEEIGIELGGHGEHAQAVVEGALLGSYKFETFRAPAARRLNSLKCLSLVTTRTDAKQVRHAVHVGRVLAEATNLVRDVGNQPGNVITPATLASRARSLAARLKLKCRIWDEPALRREGFG